MISSAQQPDSNRAATIDLPATLDPQLAGGRIVRGIRAARSLLLGTATTFALAGLWEVAAQLGMINVSLVSSPARIARVAYEEYFVTGAIYSDIATSMSQLAMALAISIIIAIPVAVVIGWNRWASEAFDPLLSALNATPRIALVPLIILWFGIGTTAAVAMIAMGSIFPILVTTMQGVKEVDRDLIKAARSFNASGLRMLTTVAVPSAVPYILAGVRLGIARGMIGVVVAGFFAGTAGLGTMISQSASMFDVDRALVGVITVALAGALLTSLTKRVENRLGHWKGT